MEPVADEIDAETGRNVAFGLDAGPEKGVRNSVTIGCGAVADESYLVVLGNGKTKKLRVGAMEFFADETGLHFRDRASGKRYLIRLEEE